MLELNKYFKITEYSLKIFICIKKEIYIYFKYHTYFYETRFFKRNKICSEQQTF